LTQVIARALLLLGAKRAWVVHGAGGIDEISTTGHTKVSECRAGAVHTFFIHPGEFGLAKATAGDLRGGDAVENAAIIRSVFDGKPGATRDIVLFNAGAALLVAGRTASVREGISCAALAIDSGAARETLDRMIRASQTEVVA
jgi:anthranilate phosphoribosyltransferase